MLLKEENGNANGKFIKKGLFALRKMGCLAQNLWLSRGRTYYTPLKFSKVSVHFQSKKPKKALNYIHYNVTKVEVHPVSSWWPIQSHGSVDSTMLSVSLFSVSGSLFLQVSGKTKIYC